MSSNNTKLNGIIGMTLKVVCIELPGLEMNAAYSTPREGWVAMLSSISELHGKKMNDALLRAIVTSVVCELRHRREVPVLVSVLLRELKYLSPEVQEPLERMVYGFFTWRLGCVFNSMLKIEQVWLPPHEMSRQLVNSMLAEPRVRDLLSYIDVDRIYHP